MFETISWPQIHMTFVFFDDQSSLSECLNSVLTLSVSGASCLYVYSGHC